MKKLITQEEKQQLLSLKASDASILLGELEHKNKMPFAGLLTWLDVPSDKPVGGSKGKRVVLPSEYAIPGLSSLEGMAINFDGTWMDKHVVTHKIGVITTAEAGERHENGGIPVFITGYIYAHDFPEEALTIKSEQADLGFSYETIDTPVVPGIWNGEEVLFACDEVVFSGAAVLLKEKAGYTNTSLVAQAEEEETQVDIEEIVEAVINALCEKFVLQAKAGETEECTDEQEMTEMQASAEEAPAEEVPAEEEKPAEAEEETPAEEKPADEATLCAEGEEVPEENPEELDFKAMADDVKAQLADALAQIDQLKADLKAESEGQFQHERKGFTYPTNLVGKYNFNANADSYETQIAEVDARKDLSMEQRMALKLELRQNHLKSNK